MEKKYISFFLILSIYKLCNCQVQKTISVANGLNEISGMFMYNSKLYGINDSDNPNVVYCFDSSTGKILDSTTFLNASNTDWEEICINNNYVFIGDFGNNNNNRKDLKIYFFPLSNLNKKNVSVDTIAFQYAAQTNFSSTVFGIYDCEAMVATTDSIYLFSKSLLDANCRMYSLPSKKGNYSLKPIHSISFNSWITGAHLYNDTLTLCSYTYAGNFTPWIHTNFVFKNGAIKKIGNNFNIISELNVKQQLESVIYVGNGNYLLGCENQGSGSAAIYLYKKISTLTTTKKIKNFEFHTNIDANGNLYLILPNSMSVIKYEIITIDGKVKLKGKINKLVIQDGIEISSLSQGTYFVKIIGKIKGADIEKYSYFYKQ